MLLDQQEDINIDMRPGLHKVVLESLTSYTNDKTGSEGLNLTEANNIILCDNWWIHSVESQAISRSYRNGQEKEVNVYRLVMEDSIEEIILEKSQLKKDLFSKFKNGEEIKEVKISTNLLIQMLNRI